MKQKHPIQELIKRLEVNWSEVTSPESDIVFGIIRFNDLIRARTDKALSQFNLSRAAFEVLASLRSLPAPRQLTPKELSESILITTGGMTKVLIYLENNDFIKRISNDEDKRSKLVKLTRGGKRLAELSMAEVAKQDKKLFQGNATSEEINSLRRELLETLNRIELSE